MPMRLLGVRSLTAEAQDISRLSDVRGSATYKHILKIKYASQEHRGATGGTQGAFTS